MFCRTSLLCSVGTSFGATDVTRSRIEVSFKLVPLNLFANGFQIYVNQMVGICCTFIDMIVTIICSTKLESVMLSIFLKVPLPLLGLCFVMMLSFPLKFNLNFVPPNLVLVF